MSELKLGLDLPVGPWVEIAVEGVAFPYLYAPTGGSAEFYDLELQVGGNLMVPEFSDQYSPRAWNCVTDNGSDATRVFFEWAT